MTHWENLLTSYEARIALAEATLDANSPIDDELLESFIAPKDLGPLPEVLRDRALSVLRKNNEIELRLRNVLETTGRELADTTRAGAGNRRFGSFGEESVPVHFDGNA